MPQFYSQSSGDSSGVLDEVDHGPSLYESLPPPQSIHGIPLSSFLDIGKKAPPNTPVYIMTSLKGFFLLVIIVFSLNGIWTVNQTVYFSYSKVLEEGSQSAYLLAPQLAWLDTLQWLMANATLLYIPLVGYHLVYLQRQEGGVSSNIVTWLFLGFAVCCVSFFPLQGTKYQPLSEEFYYGSVMPALSILVCISAPHTKKLMRVNNGSS